MKNVMRCFFSLIIVGMILGSSTNISAKDVQFIIVYPTGPSQNITIDDTLSLQDLTDKILLVTNAQFPGEAVESISARKANMQIICLLDAMDTNSNIKLSFPDINGVKLNPSSKIADVLSPTLIYVILKKPDNR